jgi:8-oxo-dGTP pyrophosphatase MutT (NUDIX family)
MTDRVRAVLVTPTGTTLLMKRIRPGSAPYWVLVGGGVEDSDPDHEAALLREIREEIAGEADILRLFHRTTNGSGETEYVYLLGVEKWDFADRTGPEFERDDRGEYILDEIPLTPEAIADVNLLPEEISVELREALTRGDLLTTA